MFGTLNRLATMGALTASLAACGNAAASEKASPDATNAGSPVEYADAAMNGAPGRKRQPNTGFIPMEVDPPDVGGPAGCISDNVTGRNRAILERLGGRPCAPNNSGSASPAANAGSLAGRWVGAFDGGTGEAKFTAAGPGAYVGEITVAGSGCAGSVKGTARANGGKFALKVPSSDGSGGMCVVTLTPVGGGLRVSEGSCFAEHGMSCGFSGMLQRAGNPTAAVNVSSLRDWVNGSWIQQGGYCASGDPIRFGPNGSYRGGGGFIDGKFTLSGATMVVTYAEIDPTTGQASGPTQRDTVKIARVGPNDMMFGKDRMKRCPIGGGKEPWHPSESFSTH